MDLPTLSFDKYLHGTEADRLELAHALVKSFRNHGFVKLVNHGLPEATVKRFLQATKDLFGLPQEAKNRMINIRGPHPQRGWSCVGAEQTAKLNKDNLNGITDNQLVDEREHYDAGPPDDILCPNKWPREEELPGFQAVIGDCYAMLQETCLQIMAAMELGLSLKPGTLVSRCIPAASEVRLNHYPAVSLETLSNGLVKRTWPHTDFGIITLLFQDDVGGLELQDRQNPTEFVPVLPSPPDGPSEMVVNISNTFQRWTNNVIRAGVHQVSVPPSMKGRSTGVCSERYSSIFFFKADRNTSVGPLPDFITDDNPAAYDDMTALQYQEQMTQKLY